MTLNRPPRVIYWHNTSSPYSVGRFNALADRGNLAFTAWFNQRQESGWSWDVDEAHWRFPARYIHLRPFAGRLLRVPVAELLEIRPHLFASLYAASSPGASASFALGGLLARATGARTAFRVLPTYDTWVRRTPGKEIAKHFLFRAVDGVKVPGRDGAAVALRYGVPRDRIHPVTQSVDVAHYGRALDLDPCEREARRRQLGLHGCVFVYVGRLWSGKGLDFLFEAFRAVRAAQPEVSLLVIGDGVDEVRYRAMARDLPGVIFAGFVQPRDLPDYYSLADALVFPTLGDPHGLVVEEAMAAGLPVICTEAAGDIRRRLPDGAAGYIVPAAAARPLAERMHRLAGDPALRRRFGATARILVARRTHERWAIDFEAFVDRVLSMPPRRTPHALLARAVGQAALLASSTRANVTRHEYCVTARPMTPPSRTVAGAPPVRASRVRSKEVANGWQAAD